MQDDISALIERTAHTVNEHPTNRDAVRYGAQLLGVLSQARDLAWSLEYVTANKED